MLDWMFMLFIIIAVLFIILSIKTSENEPYWKILFITLSTVIWFILALSNLNIQTPYTFYNSTSGNTEMLYSQYIDEGSIYLSYLFVLFAILSMIYIIVLMFGMYYQRLDDKENENM